MTANDLTLKGARATISWEVDKASDDVATRTVSVGSDSHGLGFEVAIADWRGPGRPNKDVARRLYSARLRNRAIPLVVVLQDDRGSCWLFGPNPASPLLGPIGASEAQRLLQAALDQTSGSAARSLLLQARDSIETLDMPGIDSQGLFALHEIEYGVPRRDDWAQECARSADLMRRALVGSDLIAELGFESKPLPGNALLLTVGKEPPRAVALLLRDNEGYDSESVRFGRSPVYHGLDIARQNNVPWLVVVRGRQLRLYPTAPNVGVARRGATQTYFAVDTALVRDSQAGYLTLVFSAGALRPGGSVDELLLASNDYAVDLGKRLQARIYDDVVPTLATAVARSIGAHDQLTETRLDLAYRLTLRILFRLLFQAYGEDTRLLPLHQNERYTRASLKELAKTFVDAPHARHDPKSRSLWDGMLQVWRVIDTGDSDWGIPTYDGGLFGSDPELNPEGALVESLDLRNDALGTALEGLLVDLAADGSRGPVDFRSLDVRDFGTIYEGLLESELSLATTDLAVGEDGEWRAATSDAEVVVQAGQPYFHSKSGQRRATGSYFTRPFAVEHLLARTLDPAVDDHLAAVTQRLDAGDQVGAARLLFDFRVADLAMGSGHFLVAAIGHVEAKFGAFLERAAIPGVERELADLASAAREALDAVDVEAEIDRSALLARQIARRCIYGVDANEMAVELARLAVWVKSFVPGLPMSSLDHQLVWADSLSGIGTVDEAVEALDPTVESATISMSGAVIRRMLDGARELLEDAAALKESTADEAKAAQRAAQKALEVAAPARAMFDVAVAVRLGAIQRPHTFDPDQLTRLTQSQSVSTALSGLHLGHFPFLFPEVFLRERPGFDLVVGNPPWEEVVPDEPRFWARYRPGLMSLPVQVRDTEIKRLRRERPDLVAQFERERLATERTRDVLMATYPLGRGDVDLYKAFAWRFWSVTRTGGRIGVVLPKTAFSAVGLEGWRREVLTQGTIANVTALVNHNKWVFADVHPQYTIALACISKDETEGLARIAGAFGSMDEYTEGVDSPAVFAKTTLLALTSAVSIPMVSTQRAADILSKMRLAPGLGDAFGGKGRLVREFDATLDRRFFDHARTPSSVKVYSGASFHIWKPDTGDVFAWADPDVARAELAKRLSRQLRLKKSAFFGLDTERDLGGRLPYERARLAFRGITRPTDSRTSICAVIPPGTLLTNIAPYVLLPVGNERLEAYLVGIMNSIPFDWYARRFIETQMNFHFVSSFPIPIGMSTSVGARCIEIAGRLSSVDSRFTEWAAAVGVEVGTVEETERANLVAELDALVSIQYGLAVPDVEYIFQTFHRGWDYSSRLSSVLRHYGHWSGKT